MKEKILLGMLVGLIVLGTDITTKRWALDALIGGRTVYAAGGTLPLTLAFNQGIAFGVAIPASGRWLVVGASVFVVIMLGGLYRATSPADRFRLASLALINAGAIGNLIDRVRWDRGVVDFIGPIGLGTFHWPIFNVADIAITVGATALAVSLWHSEVGAEARAAVCEVGETDPTAP